MSKIEVVTYVIRLSVDVKERKWIIVSEACKVHYVFS